MANSEQPFSHLISGVPSGQRQGAEEVGNPESDTRNPASARLAHHLSQPQVRSTG